MANGPQRILRKAQRVVEVAQSVRSLFTAAERLEAQLKQLSERVEALSSKVEDGDALAAELAEAKARPDYAAGYAAPAPLVTVCIATYNRAELLTERSIPSILNQEYKNLEILVVGDCCTDDTEARVAKIRDSRLHFVNLPERGRYPSDPLERWMVAGSAAMNEGLRRASGNFITHLDDDDEHLPERLVKLVDRLKSTSADLVWHPFWTERPSGWELVEAPAFARKGVTTGSTLYHRWFARIPWDLLAYRLAEGGDWNRLRKFRYVGAKLVREDAALLRHFREKAQSKSSS